jgi:hypothetical protein
MSFELEADGKSGKSEMDEGSRSEVRGFQNPEPHIPHLVSPIRLPRTTPPFHDEPS